MQLVVQGFDLDSFLKYYWQKSPCVIKGFLPDFEDPLDEHELAGLAQEPEIDSRVVSFEQNKWAVQQGPIDDFTSLCVGAWSLLVQGVDRYVPELEMLCEQVKPIGNWRLDDVMVSFSNAQAGVGPHIDQYDVFIVQGKGSRRWQVGLPDTHNTKKYAQKLPHPLLKQIDGFDAVIDEVLSPGDAVYIPPHHPHNGVALEDCLNYSIGFRAPTNLELLHGLIDEGDGLHVLESRYTDPDIHISRNASMPPEAISQIEFTKLRQSIIALLQSEDADDALLRFLSRQGLSDVNEASPAHDFNTTSSGSFYRLPAVKAMYLHKAPLRGESESSFMFYIDGHPYSVSLQLADLVKTLLGKSEFEWPLGDEVLAPLTRTQRNELCMLVSQWLQDGLYEFERDA